MKFSNGLQANFTITANNDGSAVSQIIYTLHAPSGTSVTSITYTDGPLQNKEVFVFYADQPANEFTSTTYVKASSSFAVTAADSLQGKVQYVDSQGHLQTQNVNGNMTAQGNSNQQISIGTSW